MKRFAVILFVGLVITGAFALAQEDLDLIGRYDDARQIDQPTEETNQIVFTRLIYNGQIPGYYKNWYTDYPKSDRLLIQGLQRLTNLDIADHERAIALTDPELFKFPFVYTSEPGQMILNNQDAAIMREYLQRGGFWVMDDFWGSFEWEHMTAQMRKILPGAEIKDIPRDHPIFHLFYDIDEVIQVPSLAYVYNGGITHEQDGFKAEVKGIWDEQGRLLVVINHNTDLGDAYEWADAPEYPNYFSGYAYRIAINTILYALTH